MSQSESSESSLSRRSFLKTLSTTAVASTAAQVGTFAKELSDANREKIAGPDAVPVTLQVNGQKIALELEPRVTLLEALRNYSHFTGPKEVCDRGTCGACTVMMGDIPIYSCMKLAIDAQGQKITTIEGLAQNGQLSKVQQAFVNKDALMCGYCTPGYVMSVTALLKKHPQPTAEQLRHGLSGNLCRCGTYPRILEAASQAAGISTASKTEVISYGKLA